MYKDQNISVKYDQLLYVLFCLYAFSVSFELILEKLFYIKTILKPFRVISLGIIGVYFLRTLRMGMHFDPGNKEDVFLYLVFIYGFIVSCVQVITGIFDFSLFYNDIFLTGLLIITYFIFKSLPFSATQLLRILYFFFLGVVINAGYILSASFFKIEYGRQSGFIDNPNYAALGLVGAMAYLLLKNNRGQKFWRRAINMTMLLLVTYIFVVTGSRAGLAIFLVVLILLFLFASYRRKILLFFLCGIIGLQLFALSSAQTYLGGNMVLYNRINSKMSSDVEDVRFVIWRGLFRALDDRGYFGMGIGQFKANFPKYYGEESNKLILEIVNRGYHLSTHNDYLAVLVDYGLPGLSLFLVFLYLSFKKLALRLLYHQEVEEDTRFLYRYTFTILSCLIVFGLTAENFQHQLYWFLLMVSTKNN